MSLHLTAGVRLGGLELDVALVLQPGEVVVLLGPNGAGKSTLLRVIAGLQPLGTGRLSLDGQVLDDPATGAFVPPERRSVGFLFQDYALFPHMSALDNIAFGPAARSLPAPRSSAQAWLERVGLGGMSRVRADQLSGGQAQRVALARALAFDPTMVLLDEPLAALDASARGEVRADLKRHLQAHPGIKVLVTHDPVEAAALGDRIIVLEAGRVVHDGTLAEIAARPRSRYIAEFAGVNVWRGSAGARGIDLGGVKLLAPGAHHGEVLAVVRPAAVSVYRHIPSGSPRNVWQGAIAGLDLTTDRVRVRVDVGIEVVAEVTSASASELGLAVGEQVWVSFKATEVDVYPA